MKGTIAMLLKAKTIVSLHKDSKNRLEVLQLPGKTSASPSGAASTILWIVLDNLFRLTTCPTICRGFRLTMVMM